MKRAIDHISPDSSTIMCLYIDQVKSYSADGLSVVAPVHFLADLDTLDFRPVSASLTLGILNVPYVDHFQLLSLAPPLLLLHNHGD